MPKVAKELTALAVSKLTTPGKHPVDSGLYLEINANGAKVWVLRITIGAKRRHVGLGSYPATTLAQAREKARTAREMISQGVDPIEHKKAAKSAIKAAQAKEITFRQCAIAYIDTHSTSWRNAKHRQDWGRSLEMYAFPVMGDLFVRDVEQLHVMAALEPIWAEKTETATRVRGRIESILDWASVRGYRGNSNPARWKGHLDKLLPNPSKVAKASHYKSVAVDQMPAFMVNLSNIEGMAAQCLIFAILTAARSGEARGARWSEFDFQNNIWSIPAERMKAHQLHQVPLSTQAIALLSGLPRVEGCDFVFFGTKGGKLSDMALSMLMRKMGVDAVPHGFRSTFRDWAGDRTNYPRDVAEMALAHTLANKVEAAYRRGVALERRRPMMQDWADYVFLNMP